MGGHVDQILDAQVKQAIDSQMAAKGFTKVADVVNPDLLLGYQLRGVRALWPVAGAQLAVPRSTAR